MSWAPMYIGLMGRGSWAPSEPGLRGPREGDTKHQALVLPLCDPPCKSEEHL